MSWVHLWLSFCLSVVESKQAGSSGRQLGRAASCRPGTRRGRHAEPHRHHKTTKARRDHRSARLPWYPNSRRRRSCCPPAPPKLPASGPKLPAPPPKLPAGAFLTATQRVCAGRLDLIKTFTCVKLDSRRAAEPNERTKLPVAAGSCPPRRRRARRACGLCDNLASSRRFLAGSALPLVFLVSFRSYLGHRVERRYARRQQNTREHRLLWLPAPA